VGFLSIIAGVPKWTTKAVSKRLRSKGFAELSYARDSNNQTEKNVAK
jgi:hypothetical protein